MDATFEQQVRERAYGLWVEAGKVHGMAHEHWCAAEAAMRRAQAAATPARVGMAPVDAKAGAGKPKAGSKSKADPKLKAAPKPSTRKSAKVVLTNAAPSASQMVN